MSEDYSLSHLAGPAAERHASGPSPPGEDLGKSWHARGRDFGITSQGLSDVGQPRP
jgi:hypothetical protein